MKTITLKLTKSENDLIHKITDELTQSDNDEEIGIELDSNPKWLSHKVYNVDKFRKFLNDEIDKCFPTDDNGMSEMLSTPNGAFYEGSESQKQDNLKSILSKLD